MKLHYIPLHYISLHYTTCIHKFNVHRLSVFLSWRALSCTSLHQPEGRQSTLWGPCGLISISGSHGLRSHTDLVKLRVEGRPYTALVRVLAANIYKPKQSEISSPQSQCSLNVPPKTLEKQVAQPYIYIYILYVTLNRPRTDRVEMNFSLELKVAQGLPSTAPKSTIWTHGRSPCFGNRCKPNRNCR